MTDPPVRQLTLLRHWPAAALGLISCLRGRVKPGVSTQPVVTVSEVFNDSFRAPICKSGTKSSPGLNISGPRCSQIQMGFNASPFSGQNTSVPASANKNVHPILNDPDVLSLERLLRVKAKVENQGLLVRLPGRLLDTPPVSVVANKAGGRVPLPRAKSADGVGVGNGSERLLESHESV